VEEIENRDQYCLLVQEFRKNVLSKQNVDTFYRRYLRNMRTIERLLKTIEERKDMYGTRTS